MALTINQLNACPSSLQEMVGGDGELQLVDAS